MRNISKDDDGDGNYDDHGSSSKSTTDVMEERIRNMESSMDEKVKSSNGDGKERGGSNNRRYSTARIKRLVRQLLIELGEDPDREGLVDTPERVAEMYAEIFSGYNMDSELNVTFSEESDVVVAREIQFYSMCEHHILPFFGKVHIAYIPDGKVFGISKLVRLVEKYAKRLQIQERMTKQIADELEDKVKGVLVVVEGDHMCMRMRGVKNNSRILTIAYRGELEKREVREQVLSLLMDSSTTRMYDI